MLKFACVQMTSGTDIAQNLAFAENAIRQAAMNGATFVATPENTDFMMSDREQKIALAYKAAEHPALLQFDKLARELGITILIGSVAVKADGAKLKNRSLLFGPNGLIATYDKIHLFDVDLPTGESRRESDMMAAGDCSVVAQTPFGKIGLTICYDIRFPHLYRKLAQNGASVLCVPSAFTVSTGQMHWEILLRARAIENGVFVIAPAQCGTHDGGRKTYGHSLIIDPWGKILAQGGDSPEIIYADINMSEVDLFRQSIPSLGYNPFFN